jgi:hypothetical protein
LYIDTDREIKENWTRFIVQNEEETEGKNESGHAPAKPWKEEKCTRHHYTR